MLNAADAVTDLGEIKVQSLKLQAFNNRVASVKKSKVPRINDKRNKGVV